MVHRLVACSASNRLTAVALAFFGTTALAVGRTAPRNRHALVVFRFFASAASQIHTLAAIAVGHQFLRTGTGSRIRRIPHGTYRTDTTHTAARIGFFGLTVGAVQ